MSLYPKLYIPAGVDIEALVEDIIRKDKRANVRDACCYVLHYLTNRQTTHVGKHEMETLGGSPMKMELLRERVGQRAADDAVRRLIAARILSTDGAYQAGNYARCYILNAPYQVQLLKEVVVTTKVLTGFLVGDAEEHVNALNQDQGIHHLLKHLDPALLTVDIEGAHFYLETLSTTLTRKCFQKYGGTQNKKKNERHARLLTALNLSLITAKRQLFKLEKGEILSETSRAATNLRLHTPIVGLKSELRSFLRYQQEELTQVDLGAAQPYLLQMILSVGFWTSSHDNPFSVQRVYPELHDMIMSVRRVHNTIMLCTSEILRRVDYVSYASLFHHGDFYENLMRHVHAHPEVTSNGFNTRKQVKKTVMYLLFEDFNPNDKQHIAVYTTFKKLFPLETALTDAIKELKPNGLAVLLQRFEAILVLEHITKHIAAKHPEIALITVHDAILTPNEHAKVVQEEMERFLASLTGIQPKTKQDVLSARALNTFTKERMNQDLENLNLSIRGKKYESILGQFLTDESPMLRPHVPEWEGKTAGTYRVHRKLSEAPSWRAIYKATAEGIRLVSGRSTTQGVASSPIRVHQDRPVTPAQTTRSHTQAEWEVTIPWDSLERLANQ